MCGRKLVKVFQCCVNGTNLNIYTRGLPAALPWNEFVRLTLNLLGERKVQTKHYPYKCLGSQSLKLEHVLHGDANCQGIKQTCTIGSRVWLG